MKKIKNSLLRCIAFVCSFLLVISAFGGCQSKTEKTVTISESSVELTINEEITLTAVASDKSKITWSSSNDNIASVSENGVIKAKSAGECTITAASGDTKSECVVTVYSQQEQLKSTYTFSAGIPVKEMFLGDFINIKSTLKINGEVKDAVTNYSISNTSVASIENGVLTALAIGECTITATCQYNDTTYTDNATLNVVAVIDSVSSLADIDGNVFKTNIAFINEQQISEQITVKYYTTEGIFVCSLVYVSTQGNQSVFNVVNKEEIIGSLKLTLTDNENKSLLEDGVVKGNLINDASKLAKMNYVLVINQVEQPVTEYNTYVKAKNVYTDFIECAETEDVVQYVSYNCPNQGGAIELCDTVTYHGLPSLKLTVPTNRSYFSLSELVENYNKHGLTVGSKITFQIRYDGEPKVAGTNYYAVGKIISENGESKCPSAAGVLSYAAAQEYITSSSTEWSEVSYVLNESSFPLVDLGLQISGNSSAQQRYIYIAAITVENPDGVDYTKNFANAVQWDNTGRNSGAAWWGYSAGVATAFTQVNVPDEISKLYKEKFNEEIKKAPVATPIMTKLQDKTNTGIVLQNCSCSLSNKMKGLIYSGNKKIRVRVYMQASGNLPNTSEVTALVFLRNGITAGYGFTEQNLQKLSPNVWTELLFDVPSEYLDADLLTVAFNLRNYLQCDNSVSLNFYLGSIAFVSE